MTINIQRLALRFQAATDCTEAKAQKFTKQYFWQCAIAMLQDHFSDHSGSRYYINQTQIQNNLKDIIVKGQRFYVWKTFQSFPERVFDVVQVGNNLNKELTMAQARYTMEEVLLAAGTPKELWTEIYQNQFSQQILTNDYDVVPIDQRSIVNYIQSNLSNSRDNPRLSANEIESLDRNLKHAQKIWMLAEAGEGSLIQIRNPSAFGRMYYKGPNLQNTPKIVRHAALGNCHEYDIESSVFAWKLSWFQQICQAHKTKISMPATLEYLDHKQAIRKRLAQLLFGSTQPGYVNIIKELITAIGFGAPLRGDGYVADSKYQKPALAQIIKAKTKLDLALADTWVQQFFQEQNDMNAAIAALARVNMADELQQVPELWEKGGKKLKTNSVVSYLYQHAEREILDWAEEFCASSEVLLTVHDCIYTRKSVNLSEFRSGLLAFGSYFKLSHEHHQAWTWEDPVDKSDPFYDSREAVVAKMSKKYHAATKEGYADGAGHDGTAEYNIEEDPYFQTEISSDR